VASYRPSAILRGELTKGRAGTALRKSLVVFQFAISIALIFSVTVIARQTRFLRTADLGYAGTTSSASRSSRPSPVAGRT